MRYQNTPLKDEFIFYTVIQHRKVITYFMDVEYRYPVAIAAYRNPTDGKVFIGYAVGSPKEPAPNHKRARQIARGRLRKAISQNLSYCLPKSKIVDKIIKNDPDTFDDLYDIVKDQIEKLIQKKKEATVKVKDVTKEQAGA